MKNNQLEILEMKHIVISLFFCFLFNVLNDIIETAVKKISDLESSALQECTINKLRDRKYVNLINSLPRKIHICTYIQSFINNFRRFPESLKPNFYSRILNTKYLKISNLSHSLMYTTQYWFKVQETDIKFELVSN